MAERKVIEKAGSEDEKKKRRLLMLKIIPVAVLAFILIAVSLAWFTLDKALDLDSFGMKSVDQPFELKTVGSKDSLKAEILDDLGYSLVADESNITSDENNRIYWLLDDESGMKKSIEPGSHGKLTFYVVPNQSGEMKIQFNIGLTGYTAVENNGETAYEKVSDETLEKFLNGHIMFFTDCKDGNYSGFLYDETLTRTFSDCEVGVPVPVTIYWVWPNTLGQILLTSTDEYLSGESGVLFADESEERELFADYIIQHTDSYFKTENGVSDAEKAAIRKMLAGQTYDPSQLASLSSMYNNADETIGTSVSDLLVELTAQ